MKKLINIMLSIVIILSSVSIVYGAIIADSAKIKVTLISQEPDPVEPGDMVDVRFKIENKGGGGTEEIIFELMPEYPFSLYSGEKVRNLGSMQAYQHGEEGIIVHYKLKVDEDAVEGDNTFDIRYKFGNTGDWIYEEDFAIRTRTDDIVLLVKDVESTPEVIPPGSEAKLKLNLENLADSLVKDLKVKIDLSSEDIPFVPIKSTTEKKIYQLDSKKTTELSFDIMAMADAESKAYKVPLEISYYDETGVKYEKEDIIGLIIGDEPDLSVGIESTEIHGGNKAGNVVIKFVNKGVIDVKLLNIKLEDSENYEIISPSEVYIGNIDSDDYETAEYDLYIEDSEEIIELPVIIDYMDANNNEYSKIETLELRMYSSMEARKYGLSKEGSIGTIIIIVIVVGGLGIYIWRQKKKGKKIFGKW